MSIALKFKSNSGQICDIQVEEIISVDGRPYANSEDEVQQLRDTLIHHQGQLDTILSLLAVKETDDGTSDDSRSG